MTTSSTHRRTPPDPPPPPPRPTGLSTPLGVEPVYPRWAHQHGGADLVVYSEEEALALPGEGWSWAETPPPPALTALAPSSVVLGDPSFTLHVHGTGLIEGAVIMFADRDEPTVWVSPTELTTGVNMALWLAPDTVPVVVRSVDGALSNALAFTFAAAAETRTAAGG
jgi:hypothetical protein